MDPNVKAMIVNIGGWFYDYAVSRLLSSGHGNPLENRIAQIDKLVQSLPADTEPLIEEAVTATQTANEAPETYTPYSGTSQITAEGKGCVPCGAGHFQTVAGGLSEAMRFARDKGLDYFEVIDRINSCETELNTFERWDGAPEKVARLEGEEKQLMDDMLNASRELRHLLSDVKSVEELVQVAARAGEYSKQFRNRLFRLQVGAMADARPEISLDEAKQMAAEQAAKEVESRWGEANEGE